MFEPLVFTLPKTDERNTLIVRRSEEKLRVRAGKVGMTSPVFSSAEKRLRSCLSGSPAIYLANHIQKPIDVRALANLMAYDDEMSSRIKISEGLLNSVERATSRVRRLALLMFSEAYLRRYNKTWGERELDLLGSFIRKHLAAHSPSKRASNLSVLAKNKETVFSPGGPNRIAAMARNSSADLEEIFSSLGIGQYAGGYYLLVCQSLYYIEELRNIPVGASHPVLKEVVKESVYLTPAKPGRLLGHEVVSILIDRSKERGTISEKWQQAALRIAGDPRVPRSSIGYQRWWTVLGSERESVMRKWLSKVDLDLFLKILDDYGKSSGNEAMLRMFPQRKRFLEGLLEQGLVSHSRLFIHRKAENFLKRNFATEDMPEYYATVRDGDISMIYLQVGNLHMIEGTHHFAMRLFSIMPETLDILNHEIRHFPSSKLKINHRDVKRVPHMDFERIRHDPEGRWQHKAISYMQDHGVPLNIEKLLSKEEYSSYLRTHGWRQ